MRVESNKSDNQIPKDKQTQAANRSGQSTDLNLQNHINSNTNHTKKDFASILNQNEKQKELRTDDKKPDKSNDNKSVDENEKNKQADSKEKKEVREEKRDRSDKDGNSENENEKGFGNVQINNLQNLDEINIPNGRLILHVADLERIIAKIRSQNVLNGKQVIIDLKRSVFEGLQIKLTINKDKSVIAEFIAANESIKNQLNARVEELAGLLKNRGVKLTELKMALSSDSEQDTNQKQTQNEAVSNIRSNNNSQFSDAGNSQITEDSDTSYQA